MDWKRRTSKGYEPYYTIEKEFNGCTYVVTVFVWDYPKSLKFWIGLSSGVKRSDLEVFESKDKISTGGISALLWVRDAVLSFPEFYNTTYSYYTKGKSLYTYIHWADIKRRNVYSRLLNYGFKFMIDDGRKILMKKFAQ